MAAAAPILARDVELFELIGGNLADYCGGTCREEIAGFLRQATKIEMHGALTAWFSIGAENTAVLLLERLQRTSFASFCWHPVQAEEFSQPREWEHLVRSLLSLRRTDLLTALLDSMSPQFRDAVCAVALAWKAYLQAQRQIALQRSYQ